MLKNRSASSPETANSPSLSRVIAKAQRLPTVFVLALLLLSSLVLPGPTCAETYSYNGAVYFSKESMHRDMANDMGTKLGNIIGAATSGNVKWDELWDDTLQVLATTSTAVSWDAAENWSLWKRGNCFAMAPPECVALAIHKQWDCRRTGRAACQYYRCDDESYFCNKLFLGLKKNGTVIWKLQPVKDLIGTHLRAAATTYPEVELNVELRGSEKKVEAIYDFSISTTPLIGIRLGQHKERVVVEEVLPGYPASEAGIQRGDTVIAIKGVKVQNVAVARKLLVGAHGESVTIKTLQDGTTSPSNIDVQFLQYSKY